MLEATIANKLSTKNAGVKSSIDLLSHFKEEKLLDYMRKDTERLQDLGKMITPYSKRNFTVEREILALEKKIELLLKHQITAAEVYNEHSILTEDYHMNKVGHLGEKKSLYEEMFSLLQHNPHYLSNLAHKIKKIDGNDFIKFIVFDMFGDLSDLPLETMMLQIFQEAMELEFKRHSEGNNLGSVFRDNGVLSLLLKQYALRGNGQSVIQDILAQPIKDVYDTQNLSLEIDVNKVYKQVIQTFENKTGRPWPRERQVSTEEANASPLVQSLCKPRIEQLKFICNHFLERVTTGVSKIPWGVRWICKQHAVFGGQYFPNADRGEISSLVGGFIYLRMFNPAIVAPEALNFVKKSPNKTTRRNLVLIAKVLQNLSNGKDFNKGELFMVPLNLFLHDKRDLMQNYFSKLIDVEDLDHKIEVDSLLNANRNVDRVFQTSLNQIFLIHRLLKENLSLFKDPNDPILPILIKLAEVPAKVKHKENHPVTLRVHNPNVKSEEFNEKSTQTLGKQNNLLSLLSMEQHPSADEACKTLLTLAKTVKASSIDYKELIQQHKRDFQGFLEKVIEMNNEHSELAANTYNRVNVAVEEISKSENKDISFSRFVSSYVSNIKTLHKRAKQLHQHVDNVQKALVSIRTRHDHLEEKLDTFRIYLQNVEKGGEKTKKKPKKKKKKKDVVTEATFAHEDLEKDGIILWVHEDQRSHTRFLIYTFKRVDRGVYEIWVHAKAFIASMNVFDEPIKLTMLELLEMENKLQNQFRLRGLITLNVNLLKRLLTKTFRDY